jgi:hypothetical protein
MECRLRKTDREGTAWEHWGTKHGFRSLIPHLRLHPRCAKARVRLPGPYCNFAITSEFKPLMRFQLTNSITGDYQKLKLLPGSIFFTGLPSKNTTTVTV